MTVPVKQGTRADRRAPLINNRAGADPSGAKIHGTGR